MELDFFLDGAYVSLIMMNQFLKPENRKKTIDQIFAENNLDKHKNVEAYILNPSFVISTLYSTFLIYQQKIMGKESEELRLKISKLFKDNFEVQKNEKEKDLLAAIRNAIAHFNVDLVRENNKNFIVFRDRLPKGDDFHFEAKILYANLISLILNFSKILTEIDIRSM